MAWASTRPAPVLVEASIFYEYRPDPDDEDELQFRERQLAVKEFRGMSLAAIESQGEGPSSEIVPGGAITEVARATGAGSYKITQTTNVAISPWQNLPSAAS